MGTTITNTITMIMIMFEVRRSERCSSSFG
jgi:hypothetical protein